MARRTIQSPGVEINEVDLSLRPADKIGTNIFITGFAPEGPNDEIVQVSSLSEFTQIYGQPTNPAERYFYHTVAQSFNSRANILVNRLPYGTNLGEGFTNKYFATVYPVVPINKTAYDKVRAGTEAGMLSANIQYYEGQTDSQFSPASAGDNVIYCIGKPTFVTLSQEQFTGIIDDSAITWSDTPAVAGTFTVDNTQDSVADQLQSLYGAGIIVLNTAKTTINQKFEGYYTSIVDNTNLYASTNYDDIVRFTASKNETDTVQEYSSLTDIPQSRLNFKLSADYNSEAVPANISQTQERIVTFEINKAQFDDTLVFGLYKLRQSVFSPEVTKLDYVLEEGYFGSIDYYRQINSPNGGQPISYYLPQILQNNSVNMAVKINPNISGRFDGAELNDDGTPKRRVRVINNQLINNVYTGSDPDATYLQIVGLTSDDVTQVANGTAIKDSSLNTYGTTYNMGEAAALPAAKYSTTKASNNKIGSIPDKLDRVFDRIANIDLFDLDIIPEAGLGTIHTTVNYTTVTTNNTSNNDYFDDRDSVLGINELSATGIELTTNASNLRSAWNTIQTKFINFAENVRKDFIYISDPLRQILVTGDNTKGINVPGQTFPLNILTPLKQLYSLINTNYAAAYATYAQVYDGGVGGQIWIPFSGVAAANYARTDANFAPWYAPAGFTRGLIRVNDIALYPNQKQRDQLYDQVNINPVAFFPSEGFVIFGQKTLQTQPSAFDRVNVRRLFLYLEKRTRETVKYFVFEPNTLFTRTNVINVLTPIFEDAKNNEGLYDYLIVCDERNNTPDVIDANELVVDIYLKPVRAAEFILVNFYATRTGQDFSEIVG
jgi:phage tail sheath protein FI